jgi:hypothetical protein
MPCSKLAPRARQPARQSWQSAVAQHRGSPAQHRHARIADTIVRVTPSIAGRSPHEARSRPRAVSLTCRSSTPPSTRSALHAGSRDNVAWVATARSAPAGRAGSAWRAAQTRGGQRRPGEACYTRAEHRVAITARRAHGRACPAWRAATITPLGHGARRSRDAIVAITARGALAAARGQPGMPLEHAVNAAGNGTHDALATRRVVTTARSAPAGHAGHAAQAGMPLDTPRSTPARRAPPRSRDTAWPSRRRQGRAGPGERLRSRRPGTASDDRSAPSFA